MFKYYLNIVSCVATNMRFLLHARVS